MRLLSALLNGKSFVVSKPPFSLDPVRPDGSFWATHRRRSLKRPGPASLPVIPPHYRFSSVPSRSTKVRRRQLLPRRPLRLALPVLRGRRRLVLLPRLVLRPALFLRGPRRLFLLRRPLRLLLFLRRRRRLLPLPRPLRLLLALRGLRPSRMLLCARFSRGASASLRRLLLRSTLLCRPTFRREDLPKLGAVQQLARVRRRRSVALFDPAATLAARALPRFDLPPLWV